jgi:hypothetical protein
LCDRLPRFYLQATARNFEQIGKETNDRLVRGAVRRGWANPNGQSNPTMGQINNAFDGIFMRLRGDLYGKKYAVSAQGHELIQRKWWHLSDP